MSKPWQTFIKRSLDILLAAFALVALLPALIAIALLIRLTSKGPVIYRQERVGMNERPFVLLKFRTMVPNAEDSTGPVMSPAEDSRITPVGRVLRRWRLDELPQLVNIIKGDMSIVGPRPERPYFVERFAASMPNYRDRHRVKPGLTGLAQVLGTYSTRVEGKLTHDLAYVRNHSILLDLWIMLKTVSVLSDPESARGIPSKDREGAEALVASHTGLSPGTAAPECGPGISRRGQT